MEYFFEIIMISEWPLVGAAAVGDKSEVWQVGTEGFTVLQKSKIGPILKSKISTESKLKQHVHVII